MCAQIAQATTNVQCRQQEAVGAAGGRPVLIATGAGSSKPVPPAGRGRPG